MARKPPPPPRRKKGTPKSGGRKKGTPNKATVEAKAACAEIVDNPRYRKKLLAKACKGTLPPAVETMLWHYAKGKPKETVALEGDLDVSVGLRAAFAAEAYALPLKVLEQAQAELKASNARIAALLPTRPEPSS
jgi:hypothetical protein